MTIFIIQTILFMSPWKGHWREGTWYVAWPGALPRGRASSISGALKGGRGGGMSPLDVKKWQCYMSLSLVYAHVICRI